VNKLSFIAVDISGDKFLSDLIANGRASFVPAAKAKK
jgi:hypothetical protein